MKVLYLIRHAKSSWGDPQILDEDRTITEQGREQAEKLGIKFKKTDVKPDVIYCSSALRAKETAELLAQSMGLPESLIEINPKLYEESVASLIEVIKAFPNRCNTVMVVAHNPTLSLFATYLSNNEQINLSPCGVFAIKFNMNAWSEITEIEGEVIECHA